jgi:hypothetical protein
MELGYRGLSKHYLSNHQPTERFGLNCGKFVILVATLINAGPHPEDFGRITSRLVMKHR